MTTANLLQYVVFLLIVGLLVKPVGAYLARVFSGQRTWLDPVLAPLERGIYRLAGVDPTADMDWKRYAQSFVAFGLGGTVLLYVVLRIQPFLHTVRSGVSARTAHARSRDEHGDQLRHHDHVAGVRRRVDDELLQPGVRPHHTELPRRRGRSRGRHRVHPRPRAPADAVPRQLLGGRDARDPLGAPAARRRRLARARVAGCPAELRAVREGRGGAAGGIRRTRRRQGRQACPRREGAADHEEGEAHRAGDRPRAGRGAGADQEPRHERRRVLQRQRRTSVRDPDAARERALDARDRGAPRLAHVHVRTDDRPAPAGVDAVRGDAGAVRGRAPRGPRRRAARPRPGATGRGPRGKRAPGRREHGG